MRPCRFITADGDRFDDEGLTGVRLRSSISNQFVSAAVLMDEQSADDTV